MEDYTIIEAGEKFPSLFLFLRDPKYTPCLSLFQEYIIQRGLRKNKVEIFNSEGCISEDFCSLVIDVFGNIDVYSDFLLFIRENWFENKRFVVRLRQKGFSQEEVWEMLIYLNYIRDELGGDRSVDEIFHSKLLHILDVSQEEYIANFGTLYKNIKDTTERGIFPINSYGEVSIYIDGSHNRFTMMSIVNEQVRIQSRTGLILDDLESDDIEKMEDDEKITKIDDSIPTRRGILQVLEMIESLIYFNLQKRVGVLSSSIALYENELIQDLVAEGILCFSGTLQDDDYSRNVFIEYLKKMRDEAQKQLTGAIQEDIQKLQEFAQVPGGTTIGPHIVYLSTQK